jgi:N-acetylglutamate synthase-like GNAT family acetyltransferase
MTVRQQSVLVRRAQSNDVERIASFVNLALGGRGAIEPERVIARLGDVGFLLAEQDGEVVGLIGWCVENLVARVTDLLVWPSRKRDEVGPILFYEMEGAAMGLQAEAVVLFLPRSSRSDLIEFGKALGCEARTIADMPRAWRETAYEAGREDEEEILVKTLRSQQVVRPL